MKQLLTIAIVLCAPLSVFGQHCGGYGAFFGVKSFGYAANVKANYHAAYIAPIVVAPAITYEPTEALKIAAIKTNYVRTDADYSRFLQFKAYEAGIAAGAQQRLQYAAPQPQYAQQTYQPQAQGIAGAAGASVVPTVNSAPPAPAQSVLGNPSQSLLRLHCAKCHGAELEAPKGGLYLDPSRQVAPESVLRAMKLMQLPENDPDVMPPAPAKLSPEEKGGIMAELMQAWERPISPPIDNSVTPTIP